MSISKRVLGQLMMTSKSSHLEARWEDTSESLRYSRLRGGAELKSVQVDQLHFELGQTNRLFKQFQSRIEIVALNLKCPENFVGKLRGRKRQH